jgi:protein-tyrosine phosphatase
MKSILVICTANICRSPMVAALLADRLAAAGLADQVAVSSAGVFAEAGLPASATMRLRAGARGLDLDSHRSTLVTEAELAHADLILVMEEAHRKAIFYRAPFVLPKVFRLAELAGIHEDLADPYGGPEAGYDVAIDLAIRYVDAGWPTLLEKLDLPT